MHRQNSAPRAANSLVALKTNPHVSESPAKKYNLLPSVATDENHHEVRLPFRDLPFYHHLLLLNVNKLSARECPHPHRNHRKPSARVPKRPDADLKQGCMAGAPTLAAQQGARAPGTGDISTRGRSASGQPRPNARPRARVRGLFPLDFL